MKYTLGVSALVLAAAVAGLLVTIVAGRLVRDHRTKRTASIRPELELALALYLAGESSPPPIVASRLARQTLETVGLEALDELRGREWERLAGLLEQTGVVVEVASRLSSRRRRVRRQAALTLAQIASTASEQALVRGLSDRDRDVRIGCAHALAELGAPEHVPGIAGVLAEAAAYRSGPVEEVLLVLGTRDPLCLELVLNATDSPALYRMVTHVAGSLRLAQLTPVLRRNLESSDSDLVASSILGLGRIGDLEVFDQLRSLLEDERRPEAIRTAAARALGRLGDPRAVAPLERLLDAPSWPLQECAAQALAQLGEAGGEALERIATDSTSGREHALAAIRS
jgi:HEAT repeat protein